MAPPDTGLALKVLHEQMAGRARSRRGIGHAVGTQPFAVLDEAREAMGGKGGMDKQHVGHLADQGDRREAGLGVIFQVPVEVGIGDGRAERAEQKGSSVRGRAGGNLGAQAPLRPLRLSIVYCAAGNSFRISATRRPRPSAVPPAANGTMMRWLPAGRAGILGEGSSGEERCARRCTHRGQGGGCSAAGRCRHPPPPSPVRVPRL